MPAPIDNISASVNSVSIHGKELQKRKIDSALQKVIAEADTAKQPNLDDMVKPIQKINAVMKSYGLQFDTGRTDGRVVTRVVDITTGETIRQIPNETVLHISERLDEVVGLLFRVSA